MQRAFDRFTGFEEEFPSRIVAFSHWKMRFRPQPLIRADELEVALDSTVTLPGILHARTLASLCRVSR